MIGSDNVIKRIKKNMEFKCTDGETFSVWNDAISYESVLYRREMLQCLLIECGVSENSSKAISQNIIDKKKEIIKILSGIGKIDSKEKPNHIESFDQAPETKLDKDSLRIVKIIRNQGGKCLKSKIIHSTRLPTARISVICQRLCKNGTLTENRSPSGHGSIYALA